MTHNSILTYFQIGHFLLNLLLNYAIAANRKYIINALRHTSGHDFFMLYVQKVNSGHSTPYARMAHGQYVAFSRKGS